MVCPAMGLCLFCREFEGDCDVGVKAKIITIKSYTGGPLRRWVGLGGLQVCAGGSIIKGE